MLWHLLRYPVSLLLAVFYRRIQARNIGALHREGPAIIAMNHPNAFTDPVAFTYVGYPLRTWYMARGDAFKPGLISAMLENIGIVPIFRLQDGGKEGLKKNDEAYRRVNHLLNRRRKVIVFAEGICIQERRLRPLKKGVARMVFGAFEQMSNEDLLVYPVGVNYNHPNKIRSNVFYNVGEPIAVKDLMPLYRENPARAQNKLLQQLEERMKALITHIDDPDNDEAVYMAEELVTLDRLKQRGLSTTQLGDNFDVVRNLTAQINTAAQQQPDLLAEFKEKARLYFARLRQNGLADWTIDPARNRKVSAGRLFWMRLLLVLGFPFHLIGLAGFYLPLKTTTVLAGKVAKTREFYSSMWLGIGLVIFTVWFLLLFFGVYALSDTVLPPLLAITGGCLGGWFSLHYVAFRQRTREVGNAIRQTTTVAELGALRQKLIELLNKF